MLLRIGFGVRDRRVNSNRLHDTLATHSESLEAHD